jgi:hypothetical protein
MQESYGEDLASHTDPASCTVARKDGREALTGTWAGGLWSREILSVRGADAVLVAVGSHVHGARENGSCAVLTS